MSFLHHTDPLAALLKGEAKVKPIETISGFGLPCVCKWAAPWRFPTKNIHIETIPVTGRGGL
jgi:hypothetical protein